MLMTRYILWIEGFGAACRAEDARDRRSEP